MSHKRDHSDLEDGEVSDTEPQLQHQEPEEPEPKRLKSTSSQQRHQYAGIDATWGQKSVFSGGFGNATTIPIGQEDDFEDDGDAMAYLMAVR